MIIEEVIRSRFVIYLRSIWHCAGEKNTNILYLGPKLKLKPRKNGDPNDPLSVPFFSPCFIMGSYALVE